MKRKTYIVALRADEGYKFKILFDRRIIGPIPFIISKYIYKTKELAIQGGITFINRLRVCEIQVIDCDEELLKCQKLKASTSKFQLKRLRSFSEYFQERVKELSSLEE